MHMQAKARSRTCVTLRARASKLQLRHVMHLILVLRQPSEGPMQPGAQAVMHPRPLAIPA